jgi:hypothetical protein
MNKSATLITAALLTLGFASASIAADTGTPAPKSHKSGKSSHSHSHKKATTAPATTK